MKQELEQVIAVACKGLFDINVTVELSRPHEQFGDYSTNVALQLASKLEHPPTGGPRAIAETIAQHVKGSTSHISSVEVAGSGFINIRLSDEALMALTAQTVSQTLAGKKVVAEYSDPNPFKVLHAGHLYTSIVGDGIAKLLEVAGAVVHRVNFGGDVGLHVGKTMYVILQRLGGELPDKLTNIPVEQRSEWMSECYVQGNNLYDENQSAKEQIITLNKRVYQLHVDEDHESAFARIYWTCRQWSYDYFNEFYTRIGSEFEKYYPESETAEIGVATVREHLGKVFTESNGAIVFVGDNYGLHTRVFINSEGLPTYEAKDIGLIIKKYQDFKFDKSVVITGNEQEQYMAVVLKAIEQFAPELARATVHLTHGIVKLSGGVKMSSRKGNILRAVDVLDVAQVANKTMTGKDNTSVVLAAVKYAFLKQRTGGDIIYDPVESVSLRGNSGPYLQYAHARARSIIAKAPLQGPTLQGFFGGGLGPGERSLVRKIGEFAEVIDRAVAELMPHHVCTYLYELAQTFNSFYEHDQVIGNERESLRLSLVQIYANTLKTGLSLLNIDAPQKM